MGPCQSLIIILNFTSKKKPIFSLFVTVSHLLVYSEFKLDSHSGYSQSFNAALLKKEGLDDHVMQ